MVSHHNVEGTLCQPCNFSVNLKLFKRLKVHLKKRQVLDLMVTGEFCQMLKGELTPIPPELFQTLKRKEHFLTRSEASITLTRKPDKTPHENYRPRPSVNTDVKPSTKHEQTKLSSVLKGLYTTTKWDLFLGWQDG